MEPRVGFADEELDDAVFAHGRTEADVLREFLLPGDGPNLFDHAPESQPALDIELGLDAVSATVRLVRGCDGRPVSGLAGHGVTRSLVG